MKFKITKQEIEVQHNNKWIKPFSFIFDENGGVYYTLEKFGWEYYATKDKVDRICPFNGKPFRLLKKIS